MDATPTLREPLRSDGPEQTRSMDTELGGKDADVSAGVSEGMIEPVPEAPKEIAGAFEEFEDIAEDIDREAPVELGDKRSSTLSGPRVGIIDAVNQTRETYHDVKTDDKLADRLKDPIPQPSHSP